MSLHQRVFTWPYPGGRVVSLAGTFNGWKEEPMEKQGNYFVKVLELPNGFHHYKFVVDNKWIYDVNQPSVDDGSGNWNNYVELGEAKGVGRTSAPVAAHSAACEDKSHQHAPQQQQQQQSKKQQRQQQNQQQQQQQQGGGKKGKQQQQQKKEPEPVVVAEEEELAPPAEEEEVAAAEEVAAVPEKKEKSSQSVVIVDVATADVDTDLAALEAFVRSVQPEGLKWQASSVSDYVFGLKKLTIICSCNDDVSVEDVCSELEKNGDLVGSAQIQGFAC